MNKTVVNSQLIIIDVKSLMINIDELMITNVQSCAVSS